MATSHTYSFSPTVNSILLGALRILRVVQEGQQPSAYMLSNARQALEYVIKTLSIAKVPIWTKYKVTFPIIADKESYTIGQGQDVNPSPSGLVGNMIPLVNIHMAFYKYALDGQIIELNKDARMDNNRYALPNSSGIPNSWYYDKQQDKGVLHLYPVPDASSVGDSIVLDVERYIYDAGVDANTLDMPLEFSHFMKWAVAEELLCEYEQPEPRTAMIRAKVAEIREIVFESNADTSSFYFLPDTRFEDPR